LFVERLICSEELGNRHQTPTLIGCMFLMNPGKLSSAPHLPSCFAAISEALNSIPVSAFWSTQQLFSCRPCF
ncbi:hypothetical protein, partial [Ramlibacter sp.]|uniref:hypothetical protein n=1 Tax=Ramlibacter sp. TaxID=1917967 RepID=UPI0025F88194